MMFLRPLKDCGSLFAVLVAIGCSMQPGDATTGTAQSPQAPAASEPGAPAAAVLAADGADARGQDAEARTTLIVPGPEAQMSAQEAMILAEPGDVIEFGEGRFDFDATLSLDGVADVVIRGQGIDKTVLSFAKQRAAAGGEGLKITKANRFLIENLTLEDSPGDAIKLQECEGLTIRRVRTNWTQGPDEANGAYGLYPVLSTNVLIEDCLAECASDAGIYVGQSQHVIVRRCRAERNVAGIEIENCLHADVYDNVATDNTGGILVFSLPGLTLKNGSDCRVFANRIERNNHPNFAKEGAMVATVPPGSGLMVMANDRVEVFENTFRDNEGAHCLIASFLVTQRKFDDPEYDPFPEAIHIHRNTFEGGGTDPQGEFFAGYTAAAGLPLPAIVVDGIFDPAKLVDGRLPEGSQIAVLDNSGAAFVNLDLGSLFAGGEPVASTDLAAFSQPLPPVAAVTIPGLSE